MDSVGVKPRVKVAWAFILLRLVEGIGIAPLYMFLPNTVADFFASETSHETMHCGDWDKDNLPDACLSAHSKAILVAGIKDFISYGLLSFFLNPVFGAWSDAYGRKPFLVLDVIGYMVPKCFIYFYVQWGVSLYGYFVSSVIFTALQNPGVLFAFVTDIVPAESKNFYFAMLFSAQALGSVLGSGMVIGGLVGSIRTAALLALCSNVMTIVILVLAFPETARLSEDTGKKERVSIIEIMSILTQNRIFICLTVCVVAVSVVILDGGGEILAQYLLEVAGFTTRDLAISTVILCMSFLSTPLGIHVLTKLKISHTNVLMVCFAALFVHFCVLAFAVVKAVAFLSVPFAAFSVVALTTISTMKSDMVSEDKQGALQGSIAAVRSAVIGIFPLIFSGVFAAFRTDALYFPGAVMLMIAVIQLIGLFASKKTGQYLAQSNFSQDVEMPATVLYEPVVENDGDNLDMQ